MTFGRAPRERVAELRELSERWFQAWLEKDAATVERLRAEDYSFVGPTGMTLDRRAILRIIRSPTYRDHGTRTYPPRQKRQTGQQLDLHDSTRT